MRVPPEIIILFFIISFLVYAMPMVLVKFSKTTKGKFLLIMLTIVVTLYNRVGGLLMAMLIIFLSEFNYEVNNGILYEGFEDAKAGDAKAGDAKAGDAKAGDAKETDDADTDEAKAKKDDTKIDLMAITEILKSQSASAVIPVSQTK
jgi:hypothetical protein